MLGCGPVRHPHYSIKSNVSCIGGRYVGPSRQIGSRGRGDAGLATSPPIGEALAFGRYDRAASALGIANPKPDAIVVTEIELREVAVQMLLAHVLISLVDAAL